MIRLADFLAFFDVRFGLGSGGGGGQNSFQWNDDIAPYWQQTLQDASAQAAQPYQQYQGQRVAFMDQNQQDALGGIRDFAMNSGSPVTHSANGQLQQTLDGDYLTGDLANPYASQQDPWANQMIQNGQNQYVGDSPQFQHVLQSGLDTMNSAYQNGTAADTTRAFNMAGAFGGSAHEHAVANNQAALAKQQSDYVSSMQNDQYNRSAQLQEGQLGRDLQADTINKGQGQDAYEAYLNRGNADFEGERARQMGAVPGGQNEQELALQRYQALMGAGDAQRAYQQQFDDLNYNDWQDSTNWGRNRSSWMSGILSGAQGGLPPTQTTTQSAYAANPFSSIMGTALAGYGMFGSR